MRVCFNNPYELKQIEDYIIKEYKSCRRSALSYISESRYHKKNAKEIMENMISLLPSDVEELCSIAKKNYENSRTIDENLLSEDNLILEQANISINPSHNRVSVSDIKNVDDVLSGLRFGYKYWVDGENLRKEKLYEKAIDAYDLSRYFGYISYSLYESYAMSYHELKDYENEILILEEGIKRLSVFNIDISGLCTRRQKTVLLLVKVKQKERNKLEKEKVISKKTKEKDSSNSQASTQGRAIIQLDDSMRVIKKYETIAEAVRETGINSKSIRSAAKGIQKHAGGYVWRYADEYEQNVDK